MRVRIVMKPFLRENPHQPAITYDISQLFDYIDTLTDLSVLVFDKENAGYSPYNKDWIKVIYFPGKIMISRNQIMVSRNQIYFRKKFTLCSAAKQTFEAV